MLLPHIPPTAAKAWQDLSLHYDEIKGLHLNQLFELDPLRAEQLSVRWEDFFLDYSKNRIKKETIQLLVKLAEQVGLKEAITSYFNGELINETEGRAVMHMALRLPKGSRALIEGVDVVPEIHTVLDKMEEFSSGVITGQLKGYSGKEFTDVVNIGIGGSDLGPVMAIEALAYYRNHLKMHFISNVEGDHVWEKLKTLNPETTLFLIVSKSFTTQETLMNSMTVRKWFLESLPEEAIRDHFMAVSTNIAKVKDFGIAEERILPMWDWVGGRFSLWSAVGLSIMLAVGPTYFRELLSGAHAMDTHFKETPWEENIPVLLGLIGIWYNNFFQAESEAVLPYSQYLHRLPAYLQQAIMESNGKSIDRDGKRVTYQTGSIIWGETGTNSQHAFFQLIHQGTKLIPADFVGFVQSLHGDDLHQDALMANFFAQTQALMVGKNAENVKAELQAKGMSPSKIPLQFPFRVFEGNKPSNTLLIDKLTPKSLGKLISLYEHKIFVQGVIWNIFSYDQWGVELGKQLAGQILTKLKDSSKSGELDQSTQLLIYQYLRNR